MANDETSKPRPGVRGVQENRARKSDPNEANKGKTQEFEQPGYQSPGEPRPYFGRQAPDFTEGGAFGRQQDDSPTGGQVGAHGPAENTSGTVPRTPYPSGKEAGESGPTKKPTS